MRVKELMTKDVAAVWHDTPLKDVAAMLAERDVSGVPVIDEGRKVLGIVSEADIVVRERGQEPRHGGLFGWLLAGGELSEKKLTARTAGDAMSVPAITIRAEKDVSRAARLLTDYGIKRLPVVDTDGTLVGIVTQSDLVKAFARGDEEIEREIRSEVVLRTLLIDAERVDVRVEEGEVTLSGQLERRSDAELLPRFVARVPGVVSVRSEVTWAWDDRKALQRSDPRVPIPPRR